MRVNRIKLRELMKNRNMKPLDFETVEGEHVSESCVKRILAGKTQMVRESTVELIAKTLNVDIDEIIY